jgi:hypothetical protein
MTTSANIATAPGPFVMVKRLPWPYSGQVKVPAYKGRGYLIVYPTSSRPSTK